MMQPLKTAFDLTTDAAAIQPPYWFYSIFFVIGVGLAVWAFLGLRFRWRGRKRLTVFAAVWLGLTSYISVTDAEDVWSVRQSVADGRIATVKGCPTYFHPGLPYGTKTFVGDEHWSIAGHEFSYGAGELRPGYHSTEPNGGAVHRATLVEASFVISPRYGRTEIVRLLVADNACTPAPDRAIEENVVR